MYTYIFGTYMYENTIAYKYDCHMNFDVNSDWSTYRILSDDLAIPRNIDVSTTSFRRLLDLRTYIFAFADMTLRHCAI